MRHLINTISLERLTSRVPSIWPAYLNDEVIYFDNESIKGREGAYPCNYGLVPLAVVVGNAKYENGVIAPIWGDFTIYDGIGDYITLSFERVMSMFHFFMEYDNLLHDGGPCHKVYNNAVDFYESEFGTRKTMPYGNIEDIYRELDNRFIAYGGNAMFKFISENVIPAFKIPDDNLDDWNCRYLYYPDAIKWLAWFKDNKDIYYNHDCKELTEGDCCECEKYNRLVGIQESLAHWATNVGNNIAHISNMVREFADIYTPKLDMRIELQNDLENPGYFSIFSEEYQVGEKYDENVVVELDGESLIRVGNASPYTIDDKYKELHYNDSAWASYTEKYINDNISEFEPRYRYYAFTPYDRKVVGINIDDVKEKCYDVYQARGVDWIINDEGDVFDVYKSEFGNYKGNADRKMLVMRDGVTHTPYVYLNGKKFYATLGVDGDGNKKYYFPFILDAQDENWKRVVVCGNEGIAPFSGCTQYPLVEDNASMKEYITSGGSIVEVTDSMNRFDRYADVEGVRYYHKYGTDGDAYYFRYVPNNESGMPSYESFELSDDVTFIGDDKMTAKVMYPDVTIYRYDVLTGRTSSKLKPLRVYNTLSDDIGNQIEGIFIPTNGRHHPYEGETLEPIYQVGNTANMRQFGENGYYIGDKIINMHFYHKDAEGEEITGSADAAPLEYDIVSGVSTGGCLNTIEYVTQNAINAGYSDVTSGSIWCDVSYLVGATLDASGNTIDGKNSGVTYTESVRFVMENAHYGLRRRVPRQIPSTMNNASAVTYSYPINIYRLVQDEEEIESATYGNAYKDALADFSVILPRVTEELSDDMEKRNGMEVFPVFMEECAIGSSTPKKVSTNIYIDRGINTALDKHLKLGEVTTLEALLNYGNGIFNVADAE